MADGDAAPSVAMVYSDMTHFTKGAGPEWAKQMPSCPPTAIRMGFSSGRGLSLVSIKHNLGGVARGDYDTETEELAKALVALDVPVFVRIGYEFNGSWNGYPAKE